MHKNIGVGEMVIADFLMFIRIYQLIIICIKTNVAFKWDLLVRAYVLFPRNSYQNNVAEHYSRTSLLRISSKLYCIRRKKYIAFLSCHPHLSGLHILHFILVFVIQYFDVFVYVSKYMYKITIYP